MEWWLLLGAVFILALTTFSFDLWIDSIKQKIYKLFAKDEQGWWLLFALEREIRVPTFMILEALSRINRERGLESRLFSIRGIHRAVGSDLIPVSVVGYRLSRGGHRKKIKKRKTIFRQTTLIN